MSRLDGQCVLVLGADALRDPKDDGGQHEGDVLGDVGVAVVGELFGVVMEDVLQDEDGLWDARSQHLDEKYRLRWMQA